MLRRWLACWRRPSTHTHAHTHEHARTKKHSLIRDSGLCKSSCTARSIKSHDRQCRRGLSHVRFNPLFIAHLRGCVCVGTLSRSHVLPYRIQKNEHRNQDSRETGCPSLGVSERDAQVREEGPSTTQCSRRKPPTPTLPLRSGLTCSAGLPNRVG